MRSVRPGSMYSLSTHRIISTISRKLSLNRSVCQRAILLPACCRALMAVPAVTFRPPSPRANWFWPQSCFIASAMYCIIW